MSETTKKISYGIGIFITIIVFLWGAWAFLGSSGQVSSTPVSIPVGENDHTKGNNKSKVTLVEFSDFQCPACKNYLPLVQEVNNKYKDKIYFVYKHFPLSIHKNAQPASLAAIAASKQKKFWEMHDLLFDKQSEWENADNPNKQFMSYAKKLKLDLIQFEKDLKANETQNKMQDDLTLGNQIGVDSTPNFYINGKKIKPPQDIKEFEELIDNELNPKK